MNLKSIFTILIINASFFSFSQIVVTTGQTPQDLVNNVLIGNNVTASNIVFSGNSSQIGTFDGTNSNIGLSSGIVMSSGNVMNIVPPNMPSTGLGGPGDADILATAQSVTSNPQAGLITSTHDAAILEFDFVPTGDTVRFRFVFASEEYLTYVNTQFNDAFGFYLSGPNPAGGNYNVQNMALVPGTTEPITISTIHPGLNSQYYIDNPSNNTHSFNGYTTPLEIVFPVHCDSTYHFKFGVADCQDGILDTGVFLEANSFSSNAVQVSVATVTGDTTIFEGCTYGDVVFTRPTTDTALTVTYTIGGTATNGVDFVDQNGNPLGTSVTFPQGEDTVIVSIYPVADNQTEPDESIVITAYTISPCGAILTTTGIIWISDEPNIVIDESDTLLLCKQDSILVTAYASGGFAPYSFTWSDNSPDNDTAWVSANHDGAVEYFVTATDNCGYSITDTVTVTVNQILSIDSLIQYPASACLSDGAVSAFVSGITSTGNPFYEWRGPGANSTNFVNGTAWQNIPSGWYYFTVTDDVCTAEDSIFVEQLNAPIAAMTPSATQGCIGLEVSFTNESQNSTQYTWDFGDNNPIVVNNTNSQTHTFNSSQLVMLVAEDANGCTDTVYVDITIEACGCTDPNATNYNPQATTDDGSCIYPSPVVDAPNVFSPNGDGTNDFFELDVENVTELELIILNRWGGIVYQEHGTYPEIPKWDGFVKSKVANEGVYFYRYRAKGVDGTEVEGHGFFHLVLE